MDNLGDLLFLLVTEPFLAGAEVTPAAPFEWGVTTPLLGRHVAAYSPLLQARSFDVIWTLGCQIGGPVVGSLDLSGAVEMSAPRDVYEEYQRGTPEQRRQILIQAAGTDRVASAFIPDPLAFPRNADAVTVINSAGIGHLLDDPARRAEHISLLRGVTHLSVRDHDSSALLRSLEIEHRLAPDTVHALSRLRPADPDPDSDVAIVQLSRAALATFGPDRVAAALAGCGGLRGLRLRVLMTGTYRGGDSPVWSKRLVEHLRLAVPASRAELIEDRRPYDLVDHIAGARVVVGTSLHLRITAAAYGVPRVSLAHAKAPRHRRVGRYAESWDPEMPYDVSLAGLDEAVAAALARRHDGRDREHCARLTELAHANTEDLARTALRSASEQTERDRAERLRRRRMAEHAR